MTALVNSSVFLKKTTVRPGIYRHYKGNLYQVIDIVTHSETDELLVLYRALYGERELWVRPQALFFQSVQVNGQTLPRFEWIQSTPADPEA